MQPHLRERVEKVTRKDFPDGIAGYGADALRLTLTNLATTGRDISLEMGRVEGNRNFCNKLWNAAHYVFTHVEALDAGETQTTVADRWIRSRLASVIEAFHGNFADYRFDLASQGLYDFIWHEFCDWYLELTKPVLNDESASPATLRGTRHCLAEVLGALLKLLHPIVPFVTEELWLELCKRTGETSDTVMLEPLPDAELFAGDAEAETEIEWLQELVIGVRQIRGEMDISPGKRLPVRLAGTTAADRERVERLGLYLNNLARIHDLEFVASADEVRGAATAVIRHMTLLVPLEGLIDLAAERERLARQQQQAQTELEKVQHKLANPQFVANAPAEVVDGQRNRETELQERLDQLGAQLDRLQEMS